MMKKGIFLLIILSVIVLLLPVQELYAQCAMCATQLQNNASSGETNVAEGVNKGILILLAAPYILVGIVAFAWYKKSRPNVRKVKI